MPTVFVTGNLRIKIHKRDHNPPHVHVEGPGGLSARFDLRDLSLMDPTDFSAGDIARIQAYLRTRWARLLEVWNELQQDQ